MQPGRARPACYGICMDTTIRATDEVAYRDVSLRDLALEWYPAGTEQRSEEVDTFVYEV